MAVIVTNIHEKTKTSSSKENRLPKFVRKLFLNKIAKVLGMQQRAKDLLKYMIKLDKKERENAANGLSSSAAGLETQSGSGGGFCKYSPFNEAKPSARNREKSLFQMIADDILLKYEQAQNEFVCNRHNDADDDDIHHTDGYFTELSDEEAVLQHSPHHRECYSPPNYATARTNEYRKSNLLVLANRASLVESAKHSPIWIKNADSIRNNNNYNNNSHVRNFKRENCQDVEIQTAAATTTTTTTTPAAATGAGKKRRSRYRIKKENVSLYFAYEYVLFALILDRLFFWIYTIATLFSYITTLYIFPFMVQADKKAILTNVP
jgi:hypothetical protein